MPQRSGRAHATTSATRRARRSRLARASSVSSAPRRTDSSAAFAKPILQPFAIERPANEDHLVLALLPLCPLAIGPAVEEHVNPLKDESARIILDAQHALHAKDVRPF